MESMHLESVLEVLGLERSDIPKSQLNCFNLYCNYGSNPIAKLYLKAKGYALRFGYDVQSKSTVDPLPSGGIRVKPTSLYRVQCPI